MSTKSKIAGGLGLAALAAGAAAAYYFSSPESKKHKKEIKQWAKNAKAEMLEKIMAMKDFSQKTYEKASKEVLAKYKQAKNIKPEELEALGKELKTSWVKISKAVSGLGAKSARGGSAFGGKKAAR